RRRYRSLKTGHLRTRSLEQIHAIALELILDDRDFMLNHALHPEIQVGHRRHVFHMIVGVVAILVVETAEAQHGFGQAYIETRTSPCIASVTRASSSSVESPSGLRSVEPCSIRCRKLETRTSTNSSRLFAVIARNFTRSSRGFPGSRASSSTRRLKSSHCTWRFR